MSVHRPQAAGSTLGPPSVPFIHGNDRLSNLRRLRLLLERRNLRRTALYQMVCERIFNLETEHDAPGVGAVERAAFVDERAHRTLVPVDFINQP